MNLTKNCFEQKAWQNKSYVIGIDEVGRGCLAGPVVTCACILPQNTKYELLKDSKILNKQQREKACNWITNNSFYSVAISNHRRIDQFNIYQATLQTMKKSFFQLLETIPLNIENIKYVLIDAMPLKVDISVYSFFTKALANNQDEQFHNFPKGETYSTSIAAASIVAKVFRDDLMQKIGSIFPQFQFDEHKGYGTKDHVNVLKNYGPTIIHRKTFLRKIPLKKNIKEKQRFLF